MEAAFCSAERVTLAGSAMPLASMSTYSPVAAFRPWPSGRLATLSATTPGSRPALREICFSGADSASRTIFTPVASSPSRPRSPSSSLAACSRATPPPATMPSSTAALALRTASSMRSFCSFSSTSVAAPTLITATPPANLARRSCSFSRSYSESEFSISARICLTRPSICAWSPAPWTRVVSSLVTTTLRAWPSSSRPAVSSDRPTSSEMTWPPVRIARSCSMALRRSPKPGAFTATDLKVPRILFTTRVDRASPSTSSAMISSGLPDCMTCSSTGTSSLTLEILPETSRMYGSSSTASPRSMSVAKYAEMKPLSKRMPSVTSRSTPKVLDSSTVITDSLFTEPLPTAYIASAIFLPISGSDAEMPAVEAISSWVSTSLAWLSRYWETLSVAAWMPRLMPIGLEPAATLRRPSRTSAWARTVAVVVPSPATSSVFLATSLTSSAPIFSYGSSSSISLAMVTPSLVIVGAPQDFSSTTLRPLGPSVTFTASARVFRPFSRLRRASSSNAIIFAM